MLGDVNARRGIGGTRPTRHHHNAGTPGEARCGIGHHRRAAFLAANSHVNIRIMQSIKHSEIGFARHTKDMLDALRF